MGCKKGFEILEFHMCNVRFKCCHFKAYYSVSRGKLNCTRLVQIRCNSLIFFPNFRNLVVEIVFLKVSPWNPRYKITVCAKSCLYSQVILYLICIYRGNPRTLLYWSADGCLAHAACSKLWIVKALANEDTLLRTQMFFRLPTCATFVADTKNVSDFVQKHFVSATNVSQFAQPKKYHEQQCVLVCQYLNTNWADKMVIILRDVGRDIFMTLKLPGIAQHKGRIIILLRGEGEF